MAIYFDYNNPVITNTATVKLAKLIVSGIENIYQEKPVLINAYPNPFNDHLFLKGFTGSVKIYNALGSLVLETHIRESEMIDTHSLHPGFYILKTSNSEIGRGSIRLLKN